MARSFFSSIIFLTCGTHCTISKGITRDYEGFDYFTLKEMSYVARGQLIDRWLGFEIARDSDEFSRRVEETERLVRTVIGKSTLPSLPFVVLSILQAAQREQEFLPENGSFGYLYEVLITSALNHTVSERPQLDRKYTFLARLAYEMFVSSVDTVATERVDAMLSEYAASFRIRLDKGALIEDLKHARVLVLRSGNYSFVYPHYFQYFLARYFKEHLHGRDGQLMRDHLRNIQNGLHVPCNRTFLLFTIYLTHDAQLTNDLVDVAKRVLGDVSESTLTREVEFYNSKEYGRPQPLPEDVDLTASRERRREADDLSRELEPRSQVLSLSVAHSPYSTDLPVGAKLDYASSSLEILGQILRNFTGSLPGEQKLEIIRTAYCLGLRTLAALLGSAEGTLLWAKEKSQSAGGRREPDRFQRIQKLIAIVAQSMGVAVLHAVSQSVGTPDLEPSAYRDALRELGLNNATQLVDLAIKLGHSEAYPITEIGSLCREFRENRYASDVLRALVSLHLHIFKIDREMRQRVISLFGGKKPTGLMLSDDEKRFRD